jgi:hypothetical protein
MRSFPPLTLNNEQPALGFGKSTVAGTRGSEQDELN